MTGPEHYRKAEELLAEAATVNEIAYPGKSDKLVAAAQVHATLAHAAATALAGSTGRDDDDLAVWRRTAGVSWQQAKDARTPR